MKTTKKMQKTFKYIFNFLNKIYKNYKLMKTSIKKIWASCITITLMVCATSCNVSRTVTTKAEYFQKGDTTTTIVTKTTETYNAEKK